MNNDTDDKFTVIVCGDRKWNNYKVIEKVLDAVLVPITETEWTVIDGGATGADTLGHKAAKKLGCLTKRFPAKWRKYGKSAGPIRNRRMLKQKPDLVVAFHNNIEKSKGTKDMIFAANKANVEVRLYSEKCELL